jgi:hypothetical protein
LKVVEDLRITGEFPVGADAEAEVLLRRLRLRLPRKRDFSSDGRRQDGGYDRNDVTSHECAPVAVEAFARLPLTAFEVQF